MIHLRWRDEKMNDSAKAIDRSSSAHVSLHSWYRHYFIIPPRHSLIIPPRHYFIIPPRHYLIIPLYRTRGWHARFASSSLVSWSKTPIQPTVGCWCVLDMLCQFIWSIHETAHVSLDNFRDQLFVWRIPGSLVKDRIRWVNTTLSVNLSSDRVCFFNLSKQLFNHEGSDLQSPLSNLFPCAKNTHVSLNSPFYLICSVDSTSKVGAQKTRMSASIEKG
jgi:hypothetical protein